jgi:hypothetical protein
MYIPTIVDPEYVEATFNDLLTIYPVNDESAAAIRKVVLAMCTDIDARARVMRYAPAIEEGRRMLVAARSEVRTKAVSWSPDAEVNKCTPLLNSRLYGAFSFEALKKVLPEGATITAVNWDEVQTTSGNFSREDLMYVKTCYVEHL